MTLLELSIMAWVIACATQHATAILATTAALTVVVLYMT